MSPTIRTRLQLATNFVVADLKPGRNFSVHAMSIPNMPDSYQVFVAWYEGQTRYSVIQIYNAFRNQETPEEWVNRALRAEVAGRGEQAIAE